MIPTSVIQMSDLSRQKRFRAELAEDLTPDHTVDQAVELYLDRMGIPDHGLPWSAFSRGVRLDRKRLLGQLPELDDSWVVMPEVSAGAR